MKNVNGNDSAPPSHKRKLTLADLTKVAGGATRPPNIQIETKEDVKVIIR